MVIFFACSVALAYWVSLPTKGTIALAGLQFTVPAGWTSQSQNHATILTEATNGRARLQLLTARSDQPVTSKPQIVTILQKILPPNVQPLAGIAGSRANQITRWLYVGWAKNPAPQGPTAYLVLLATHDQQHFGIFYLTDHADNPQALKKRIASDAKLLSHTIADSITVAAEKK